MSLHVKMMFKSICTSHIVMRPYRETVIFVNVPNIDAFDLFECCEVFVFSVRAMFAQTMVLISAINGCGNRTLKESGTIWEDLMAACLARIKSNSQILLEVRGLTS